MTGFSRKAVLAVEAVLDVALHAQPDPVQAREITKRQGVPQRHLEPVMQQLARAGILRGVRGPKGGYTLARERRRIAIGDIVRAVASEDDGCGSTSPLNEAIIAPFCAAHEDAFLKTLDGSTIEDLWREAKAKGVTQEIDDRRDFTI